MTPTQAIRAKCLECSGGSSNEVKACPVTGCILHPFRFGKNPNIMPREYTEEQRAAMRERGKQVSSLRNKSSNQEKTANPPAEGKFTSEVETPPEST